MGGKHTGTNYDLAKAEADKVDAQIIETLKTGHSFRVEAGAFWQNLLSESSN